MSIKELIQNDKLRTDAFIEAQQEELIYPTGDDE